MSSLTALNSQHKRLHALANTDPHAQVCIYLESTASGTQLYNGPKPYEDEGSMSPVAPGRYTYPHQPFGLRCCWGARAQRACHSPCPTSPSSADGTFNFVNWWANDLYDREARRYHKGGHSTRQGRVCLPHSPIAPICSLYLHRGECQGLWQRE